MLFRLVTRYVLLVSGSLSVHIAGIELFQLSSICEEGGYCEPSQCEQGTGFCHKTNFKPV
jgi:hypothetical protein